MSALGRSLSFNALVFALLDRPLLGNSVEKRGVEPSDFVVLIFGLSSVRRLMPDCFRYSCFMSFIWSFPVTVLRLQGAQADQCQAIGPCVLSFVRSL